MVSGLPVLVLSLASFLAPLRARAAERPPRIVVDPGHGGAQDGATSPAGVLEKDISLRIAQRVRRSNTPER